MSNLTFSSFCTCRSCEIGRALSNPGTTPWQAVQDARIDPITEPDDYAIPAVDVDARAAWLLALVPVALTLLGISVWAVLR